MTSHFYDWGQVGTGTVPASASSSAGHFDGFELTRVDADTLQIATGKCRDDADAYSIVLTDTQDVDITNSGANGLDTGLATNVPYHVYICYGTSGVCGLISADLTPVLPSGYDTAKRLIGSWVRMDGTFKLLQQVGSGRIRRYQVNESRNDWRVLNAGTATSWAAVGCSDVCPQSAALMELNLYMWTTSSSKFAYIRPSGFTNASIGTHFNSGHDVGAETIELINNDEEFQYLITNAVSTTLTVYFMGWTEYL